MFARPDSTEVWQPRAVGAVRRLGGTIPLILLLAAALSSPSLDAQSFALSSASPATQSGGSPQDYWANRGRWNFGAQLGFGLENAIPRNISHIALLIVQPQVGIILRDFTSSPVRRFEIINEGILGNAVHPGGHLLGYALLFRFDGRKFGRIVPLLDLGAGMQHTTLETRAPELSGRLQFSPQAGVGIQFFFSPQRALVLEYRYLHMSNAGIQKPNHGFNGSMLTLGFRWLRRPRPIAQGGTFHHTRNPFHLLFGGN
jgi:hypothetical protein